MTNTSRKKTPQTKIGRLYEDEWNEEKYNRDKTERQFLKTISDSEKIGLRETGRKVETFRYKPQNY